MILWLRLRWTIPKFTCPCVASYFLVGCLILCLLIGTSSARIRLDVIFVFPIFTLRGSCYLIGKVTENCFPIWIFLQLRVVVFLITILSFSNPSNVLPLCCILLKHTLFFNWKVVLPLQIFLRFWTKISVFKNCRVFSEPYYLFLNLWILVWRCDTHQASFSSGSGNHFFADKNFICSVISRADEIWIEFFIFIWYIDMDKQYSP